jgi:hypothetical protein
LSGREESDALLTILAGLAAGDDPATIVVFAIRSDAYDAGAMSSLPPASPNRRAGPSMTSA